MLDAEVMTLVNYIEDAAAAQRQDTGRAVSVKATARQLDGERLVANNGKPIGLATFVKQLGKNHAKLNKSERAGAAAQEGEAAEQAGAAAARRQEARQQSRSVPLVRSSPMKHAKHDCCKFRPRQ